MVISAKISTFHERCIIGTGGLHQTSLCLVNVNPSRRWRDMQQFISNLLFTYGSMKLLFVTPNILQCWSSTVVLPFLGKQCNHRRNEKTDGTERANIRNALSFATGSARRVETNKSRASKQAFISCYSHETSIFMDAHPISFSAEVLLAYTNLEAFIFFKLPQKPDIFLNFNSLNCYLLNPFPQWWRR